MTSLFITGITITAGIASLLGALTHFAVRGKLSRGMGITVVVAACVLWHALAWASLDHATGAVHRVLFVTIIVPFGFGFGQGDTAFLIAISVQAALACAVGTGVYLALSRKTESRTRRVEGTR
jgi:hypothetical protein